MALNVKNADVVISNTATIVYTIDNVSQATILKATVLNTDSILHTIDIYRVPNGSTAGSSNMMFDQLSVNPSQTVVLPLNGQVLVNGQSLQATCDTANMVNFSISLAVTP